MPANRIAAGRASRSSRRGQPTRPSRNHRSAHNPRFVDSTARYTPASFFILPGDHATGGQILSLPALGSAKARLGRYPSRKIAYNPETKLPSDRSSAAARIEATERIRRSSDALPGLGTGPAKQDCGIVHRPFPRDRLIGGRAAAIAAGPQDNVRSFYATLLDHDEGRRGPRAERSLCEVGSGRGQSFRCPVDDPTCHRLVLGGAPSGSPSSN